MATIKDGLGLVGFTHVLGFTFHVILQLDNFMHGVVEMFDCLLFHGLFLGWLIIGFTLVEVLTDYASQYHFIIAIHLQTNFQLCN